MIEQYIQEIGQAGRDGEPSTAVLPYGSPGKHIKQNMKKYGENKRNCRRQLLYKDFLFTIIMIMHNQIVLIYVIH